jgi:plastocyanin
MGYEEVMARNAADNDPMLGEVRFKVPLPILIPIGAVATIGLVTIGFSRVLLAIPPEAATAVAVVTAANILGACAVIALKPRLSQASMVELGIVVLYPVLIGIVIAQLNIGEAQSEAAPAPPQQQTAVPGEETVVAEQTAFNTDTIELKAGEQASIQFENKDPFDHNIAIYEDAADAEAQENAIFQGDHISASTTTYEFKAPPKGDYLFQCDLHPTTMKGTVTVS